MELSIGAIAPPLPATCINDPDHAALLLSDARLSPDPAIPIAIAGVNAPNITLYLGLDPSEHRTRRKRVSTAFTKAAVAKWQPSIESDAAQLLQGLTRSRDAYLGAEYARPLATRSVLRFVGLPLERAPQVSELARQVIGTASPRRRLIAAAKLYRWVDEAISSVRHTPSSVRHTPTPCAAREWIDNGVPIEDIRGALLPMMTVGVELGARSIMACIADATRAECAADDRSMDAVIGRALIASTVDRVAREPVSTANGYMRVGDRVRLQLYPSDTNSRTFPFGHGPHYCLGAPWIRVLGLTAVRELLAVFPASQLLEEHAIRDIQPGGPIEIRVLLR